MNPVARRSNIFSEHLQNEVVLYDKAHHKVHCLNNIAALVWENADGTRSVEQLTELVEKNLAITCDKDIALLALEQLDKAELLESPSMPESDKVVSRRALGRKLIVAGVCTPLIPIVASLLAPTPAMASSGQTAANYETDLQSVDQTIAADYKAYLKSPAAQTDFNSGVTAGADGLLANAQGNTKLATQDFQSAENDFNSMLEALNLPPL